MGRSGRVFLLFKCDKRTLEMLLLDPDCARCRAAVCGIRKCTSLAVACVIFVCQRVDAVPLRFLGCF